MRHAEVEGAPADGLLGAERPVGPEVVPQPQRDRRQHQSAAPASAVGHGLVAVSGGDVGHGDEPRDSRDGVPPPGVGCYSAMVASTAPGSGAGVLDVDQVSSVLGAVVEHLDDALWDRSEIRRPHEVSNGRASALHVDVRGRASGLDVADVHRAEVDREPRAARMVRHARVEMLTRELDQAPDRRHQDEGVPQVDARPSALAAVGCRCSRSTTPRPDASCSTRSSCTCSTCWARRGRSSPGGRPSRCRPRSGRRASRS